MSDARQRRSSTSSDDAGTAPASSRSSGDPTSASRRSINAICGRKVSIVSDKPQTTRHRIMGVLTRPDAQLVFVDTPGLHKAVSALGERVNATALGQHRRRRRVLPRARRDDAVRKGDRWVAERIDVPQAVVIVNKIDVARAATRWWRCSAPPASSTPRRTSRSRRAPATASSRSSITSTSRLPDGPKYFPDDERQRHARGAVGRRARPRAAAGRHPRRAAVLDRHPRHRVGVAAHPVRHHRRAREPEGDGDRQGRQRAQAGRRARPGAAARRAPTSSSASRSTRTGSAARTGSSASGTEPACLSRGPELRAGVDRTVGRRRSVR